MSEQWSGWRNGGQHGEVSGRYMSKMTGSVGMKALWGIGCIECGASVSDPVQHDAWHDALANPAPVVARPAPQTEGDRDHE